jgi:hypothetical protein
LATDKLWGSSIAANPWQPFAVVFVVQSYHARTAVTSILRPRDSIKKKRKKKGLPRDITGEAFKMNSSGIRSVVCLS